MSTRNSSILTKKYKRALSTQHSLYRLIGSTADVKNLIIRLSRLLCQVMYANECAIILLDPTKRYASFKCVNSARKRFAIERKTRLSAYPEKEIVKNASSIRRDYLLCAPLLSDEVIGMVILKRNRRQAKFEDVDLEILSALVTQASMGIKNLQLQEEQQKMTLGSIKSIVNLLDSKMPREYAHTAYFSKLVAEIAHRMNLSEREIRVLKYASMLHDAGEIDIPTEILKKRTKLTRKEFSVVKHHPVIGAKIFKSLQILKPAIPIILYHHEKYDGTGYPSHLKKGRIPLGARIMAVADAFEAMVFGRPYRGKMNIIRAIEEVRSKSGTQFDPKIVEAFLKAIKSFNLKKYLKAKPPKFIIK